MPKARTTKEQELETNAGVMAFLDPYWQSVGPVTVIICCIPALFLTNWVYTDEAILTIFVILNTYIRIVYPSCYIPHT